MSVVTCRCSNDDRTAPSTSTANGPTTRKDLATCPVNSGLVGKIHNINCNHKIFLLILYGCISDNGIILEKKVHIRKSSIILLK